MEGRIWGELNTLDAWMPDILYRTHTRAPQITLDFFEKRNKAHTAAAYFRAVRAFLEWAERAELDSLAQLTTGNISNYIRGLQGAPGRNKRTLSDRSRAQVLACLRGYFRALVEGGALPFNPAASVESYKFEVKKTKATPLSAGDMRRLLDSIDPGSLKGLQDRLIIAMMAFTCARVGAVVKLRRNSVEIVNGRAHVRLEEKRGKIHTLPCSLELDGYVRGFLERTGDGVHGCDANPAGWLFRRWDAKREVLTGRPITQMICYRMVKARAKQAKLGKVTNHSFRATGITEYIAAGASMEDAMVFANHSSTSTTRLYNHNDSTVKVSDVDRLVFNARKPAT